MRKALLTAIGVLLIAGSAAQATTASARRVIQPQAGKYQSIGDRNLSVQDAVHFGLSQGHCGYHSGYGSLYGDGYFPDGVCGDGGSHLIH